MYVQELVYVASYKYFESHVSLSQVVDYYCLFDAFFVLLTRNVCKMITSIQSFPLYIMYDIIQNSKT